MTKIGLESARPPQIERLTRGLERADGHADRAKAGAGEKKDDVFAALLKRGADKVQSIEDAHRGGGVREAVTGRVAQASQSDGAAKPPEPEAARSEAWASGAGASSAGVPGPAMTPESGAVLPAPTGAPEERPQSMGTSQRGWPVTGPDAAPEDRVRDAKIRATVETAAAVDRLSTGAGRAPGDDVARHEGGASAAARDHATSRSMDRLVWRLIEPEPKPQGEVVRWSALKGEVVRQETHFPVSYPHHPDMRPVTGQVVNALATMARADAGQPARGHGDALRLEPSTIANASPLRVLELRLQPAELGTVRLHLLLKGEGLTLKVSALRAETAEMLQRDQSQLKDALRQAGIQVENVVFVKDAERIGGGPSTTQAGEAGRQIGEGAPDQPMSRGEQMAGREEREARRRAAADEDRATATPATDSGGIERTGTSRDDGLYL